LKFKNFIISTVAILAVSTTAQAVTIDFESLQHNGVSSVNVGITYSEDDFTITKGAGESSDFATWGTNADQFTGSTAMFNNTVGGITILEQDGGGAFSVESIDLAELLGPSVAHVVFTGTLDGGLGTVAQSFTLDGIAFGAETFDFSLAFAGLVQLEWAQAFPFHQFDNIVLTGSPMPAVPVPAAFWLFGTALIGFIGISRRRKVA
jgi:hypothetical protein